MINRTFILIIASVSSDVNSFSQKRSSNKIPCELLIKNNLLDETANIGNAIANSDGLQNGWQWQCKFDNLLVSSGRTLHNLSSSIDQI